VASHEVLERPSPSRLLATQSLAQSYATSASYTLNPPSPVTRSQREATFNISRDDAQRYLQHQAVRASVQEELSLHASSAAISGSRSQASLDAARASASRAAEASLQGSSDPMNPHLLSAPMLARDLQEPSLVSSLDSRGVEELLRPAGDASGFQDGPKAVALGGGAQMTPFSEEPPVRDDAREPAEDGGSEDEDEDEEGSESGSEYESGSDYESTSELGTARDEAGAHVQMNWGLFDSHGQ